MALPQLSNRLMSALPYIRKNSFVADVGTDHAYLPIYLFMRGKIRGAVASDIGKGPLTIAQNNIKANGLENKIASCLSDGLLNIKPYAPEDIIVFGMGGELIVSILSVAPWVKDPNIRLILQPMTKTEFLRGYLAQNGFDIIGETLTTDEGRIYQTLCAVYDGKPREYSPLALLVGQKNLRDGGALLHEYLLAKQKTLLKIQVAKISAGLSADYENGILAEIHTYLKENPL